MERVDHAGLGKKGEQGLILYDGVCVLCSRWFQFVAKRDTARKFLFTSIQSDHGRALALRLGIDPDNPDTNAVLLEGNIYLRSDSALAALAELPRWRWVRVLNWVPRLVRDPIYRAVASNRYSLFGRRDTCYLGGADYSDRVIS